MPAPDLNQLFICQKDPKGNFLPLYQISECSDLTLAAPVPRAPKKGGLPKGWENWGIQRQKNTRVGKNTPLMGRIGTWFDRRVSTRWSVAEAGTLSMIDPEEEEVEQLEQFYLAEIPKDEDYRRRDLMTLLNNWNGEADKARTWLAS